MSKPCPLCGGSGIRQTWIAQGVAFVRCESCGLWRQDPQPELEAVIARYGDEYLAYETARHMEYRAISLMSLSEAGLHPSSSTDTDGRSKAIVEIGCATGALLAAFKDSGWDAFGVEAGPSMAAYARSNFGLGIATGTIETAGLPDGAYDVALATHLVEHLNDPRSFLRSVRRALKSDGTLYLVTPNVDGFQARLLGDRWRSAIRDHLYLFSVRTLSALLESEGFSVGYTGTWGGWPAGMKPSFLKKPFDRAAKRLGWGDVMVVRARAVGMTGKGG